MKIQGRFCVTLADGDGDQWHPNGGWAILTLDGTQALQSIDWRDGEDQVEISTRLRTLSNQECLVLDASSYTGKTGIKGDIIAFNPNGILTVVGEAWGPTPFGEPFFRAYTFEVSPVDAVYCGSLTEFVGMRADANLTNRIHFWMDAART
jgi:hypothetical protein